MPKTARPATLALSCLALALGVAASCNKKPAEPGPQPTKTVPALQYTPRPNPPTPTLRPGQPTRLPSLPG
jgi:hypothetical protein